MTITYDELSKHPIMDRPAILYAAFAEILPRQPELFTGPPASDECDMPDCKNNADCGMCNEHWGEYVIATELDRASDAGLRDTVNLLMGFAAGLADKLGMTPDEFHDMKIIRNAEKALKEASHD